LYYANIHNSSDNYGDSNVRSDKGMHLTSGKGTYVVKVGEAKALKEIESLLGSSSGQGAAPKGDPTDGDDDGWDQRGSAAATTTDSDSGSKENRVIITWTVRQTYNENTPWALAEPLANGKGGSVTVSGKSADGKKTTGSGARVGGQIVSQATCEYYNEDTFSPGISITECKSKDESRYCCEQEAKKSENLGKEFVWDEDTKQCKEKTTTTPPPTGPQPPPTGPQPQPTVKKTRLARYFEWVPSEATCHKALEEGKAPTKNETYCNGGKIAVQQDKQHCMYPSGELVLNSDAAAKFVNDVVKKYNETYKDKPAIVYGEKEHPSAGEFADALNIAPTVGITDVPKSAVCELGRRMVQESEDPHLKGDWHNELGAFFAYIHKEAVFYPAKFYKAKGNCDERFMGQGIDEGVCKNGTVPQAFHHNNYTYNGKTGMNGYESSAQELGLPAGRNGKYPLAALGEGLVNGLYDTCYNQTANKTACGTQVNDYRRAVGPLIDSNQDQGGVGVGNACNTLSGTMKVKDALDYVIQVCKNGLNAKPSSVSGNGNGQSLQNTGNTADTGKNPNDNSSRKGNNGLR